MLTGADDDLASTLADLRQQLDRLVRCAEGAQGFFREAVDEEKRRLESAIEAAQRERRLAKPIAVRRAELLEQRSTLEAKLGKNRELHEQARKRAEQLQSYVESQEARLHTIQQELQNLAVTEASSASTDPQEAELLRKLAELRAKKNAGGTKGSSSFQRSTFS